METEWAISVFIVAPLAIMLVSSWFIQSHMNKSNEKLIHAQQDTIQRLINREPVTYEETGQTPRKQERTVYAAWGAQMVDMNEDESRQ